MRSGRVRSGIVRCGWNGSGSAWHGCNHLARLGTARSALAWFGGARCGETWQGCNYPFRQGAARSGSAIFGSIRLGRVRHGMESITVRLYGLQRLHQQPLMEAQAQGPACRRRASLPSVRSRRLKVATGGAPQTKQLQAYPQGERAGRPDHAVQSVSRSDHRRYPLRPLRRS